MLSDVTTSSPQFSRPVFHLDFNLDILDDLDSDDDWMSVPYDRPHSDHWMTPDSPDAYSQSYSPHPDYYSFQHQSASSESWSHIYGDYFTPYSATQTPPQKRFPAHRRAPSNSTASTSSPQQQHPAAYPPTLFDNSQYRHLQSQYYPTPIHTPTSGSFMDQQHGRGGASSIPRHNTPGQMKPQVPQIKTTGPPYPPQQPSGLSAGYLTPHSATSHTSSPRPMNGDMADGRYHGQTMQHQQYPETYAPAYLNPNFGNHPAYAPPQQMPRNVPHLEPTMTQACANEGYNPLMNGQGAQQPAQHPSHMSMPDHMSERLQAANAQRQAGTPFEQIKREPSPYRPESQLAREDSNFVRMQEGQASTAAHVRQQQKLDHDSYQYWRHHTRGEDPMRKAETISPKDAYLDDFKESAEQSNDGGALFRGSASSSQQQQFGDGRQSYGSANGSRQHFPPTSNFDFAAPGMPASASIPDYKFTPLLRQQSSSDDTPAHLVSMETSKSEPESSQETPSQIQRMQNSSANTSGTSSGTPTTITRPSGSISTADTGTYSCTYIGCPQRFPTPALLQKHKKDAHRPAPGSATRGGSAAAGAGVSSPAVGDRSASPTAGDAMSQAGPHRCDRINPSTNKPCNTVFSRPYDLTRHEDTIHARRPKVHCQYCAARGEEKTFSRADALTRHLRVVHPDVEVRGLHGRRRGL